MEESLLRQSGIRLVIPSSGRAKTATAMALLPEWVEVAVRESEAGGYADAFPNPLLVLPDNAKTLGTVRNAILDAVDDETVVMIDDDIRTLYCITGETTRRIDDQDEIVEVIANCAVMARDAGVTFFGFGNVDIRKYRAFEPFVLNSWLGCVVGVNGRKLRFAEGRSRVDIDFTMQCLLVDRIIWQDARYWFSQTRDDNVGGSAQYRTGRSDDDDIAYLKSRWGHYLNFPKQHKSKTSISINVPRRQDVKYG